MNPRTPLTTAQAVAILRALRPYRPRSPGTRSGPATAIDHEPSSLPLRRQCSPAGAVTLAHKLQPIATVVPGDSQAGDRSWVGR